MPPALPRPSPTAPRRRAGPAALAVLLGVLAAAGGARAAYEETEVADGGTVSGLLRFAGTPPVLEPLRVNKNRDVCGERKPSEALVLGTDLGVKGGVVWIEGVARGKRGGGEVVLDNAQCVFAPHVAAAMAGARVRVRNSDPILHNTHGLLGGRTLFNLALPNKDQVVDVSKRMDKPGAVRVLCDAHPHMLAWVVIHDSPYVAITDERGAFRIDGVPPGTYRVTVWHEGFRATGADKDGRPLADAPRTVTKEIRVPARGSVRVDFELR